MSTPSPLAYSPLKVTQDVDFGPPIRQIIAQTFGEDPATYAEEIQTLNRTRQDALRGGAGGTTGESLNFEHHPRSPAILWDRGKPHAVDATFPDE
jgi:BRO1-like domain